MYFLPPQIILVFFRVFIFRYLTGKSFFYGNLQVDCFYVFPINPPLLLLWKNGKEFLLVDLKILKNGFFWKIFSWVWRFMGSGLELFLFLVFVVEGFIVFRSFFDNWEGLIFWWMILAASYSEKGPLEKFLVFVVEGYAVFWINFDNAVNCVFLGDGPRASIWQKGHFGLWKIIVA